MDTLKIAIHQPNLFPRLKVLQKLAVADVWCVLDSVQYCTREWQNRTIIVPTHGNNTPFYLTIPVSKSDERKNQKSKINEMIIDKLDWLAYIERTLTHAFRSAEHWDSINMLIKNLRTNTDSNKLTDLCVNTTNSLLQMAGKKPIVIYSSELPVLGKSSNLIANICRYLNYNVYLTDSGSRNYLKYYHFDGIKVLWQNWQEPLEQSENISSWRNISCLNYLSRFGQELFIQHLLNAEFDIDLEWQLKTKNI